MNYQQLIELLKENGEEKYKAFTKKIVPEVDDNFGVRMPILKKLAKSILKNSDMEELLNNLHKGESHEEKLIEGYLIASRNYDNEAQIFEAIENYIVRINNWALCDSFVTALKKLANKNKEAFFIKAKQYIKAQNPWEIRVGLIIFLDYFCNEAYLDKILEELKGIKMSHYYVKMGEAWLLSMLYFVDKVKVVDFLLHSGVDKWTVNKSFQKIVESRKLDINEKEFIKKMKKNVS